MDPQNHRPPKTILPSDLLGLMAVGDELRANTLRLIEKLLDAEVQQRVIRIEMRQRDFNNNPRLK